jgi:dihydrodipicolinate synthase/N-acetylneuraminate lyase
MSLHERLQGIFPPVVTTFDSAGEIAPIPFRENLRRWLETPIDGVVLFG